MLGRLRRCPAPSIPITHWYHKVGLRCVAMLISKGQVLLDRTNKTAQAHIFMVLGWFGFGYHSF